MTSWTAPAILGPMKQEQAKSINAAAWFYSQPGFGLASFSDEIPCSGCRQVPATVGSFCAACRKAMGLK